MRSKIEKFFKQKNRHHTLFVATICAFAFLIVEKFATAMTGIDITGGIQFDFSFGIKDLLCVCVYVAVSVLLLMRVKHKYILIPDSVLFAIKLHVFISGFFTLIVKENITLLTELSLIENVTESFFFALFLTILFIGKLTKSKRLKRICPFLCLGTLAICFPATLVFESVKVFIEETYYHLPMSFTVLIFIRNVANEMFLDLPYALLVLLMFFAPQNKKCDAAV